jgi:hypothetical protein
MSRGSSLAALLVAVLLLVDATTAQARRRRPGSRKPLVAVFPVASTSSVPDDISREFDAIVSRGAQAAGLNVLATAALDKKLKTFAIEAIRGCNNNAPCVAKLGKKVKAETVVYATAVPSGDNALISVFVVLVRSAKVETKATLEVSIREEVQDGVAAVFPQIFGVELPKNISTSAGETDALAAMGDLELAPVGPLTPEAPVEPAPDELPDDLGAPDTAAAEPTETTASNDGSGALVDPLESEPEFEEIAGTGTPTVTLPADAAPVDDGKPGAGLLYTAIVVGGLGAAAATTGGVFGTQALILHNGAEPKDVPQLTAQDRQTRSETAAGRANLLYIVGGSLAVVAGVLFAIDVVLFDRFAPAASVTGDGAQVGALLRF